MILTDNYSNLFSILINGSLTKKNKVIYKNSKKIFQILNLFMEEGFINSFEISKSNCKYLNIYLKYNQNKPVFSQIIRISKPGKRVYLKNKLLFNPKYKGFYILSTSKGIMTNFNAKQENLGGEIICKII